MHTWSMRCTLVLTFNLAAGCTSSGVSERQPAPEVSRIVAPVTYTGQLPCADCPGIRLTVTLFPDSTFRLRQVYQDRPAVFHDLGRWLVEENGTRLMLRSGTEVVRRFQIVRTDSLRMLDTLGQPIPSQLNYSLVRIPQVDSVRDTMWLRGMYSYMADAGRFTECLAGVTFPVAQVGANAALEQAYLNTRPQPGAPLLVSFRGHFEVRPGMEGDRRLEHVVVDSFDRIWPGGTCEERMPATTLENTNWKLLELDGRSARTAENLAEPNLRLDSAQKLAHGSTGCNQFSGHYELSGDSLRLGPLASTRRACLDSVMNEQESAFLRALEETRIWKITSDTLVLSSETRQVARFAAQQE